MLADVGTDAGIGERGGLHWPAPGAQGLEDMQSLASDLDELFDYAYYTRYLDESFRRLGLA